jgi:small subunit ribosomal protein S15Ae
MDVLSNCLKAIVNAERAGKRQVLLRPVNKIVIKFLRIMQKKSKHCGLTNRVCGRI